MSERLRLPIGTSDFRQLRREGLAYVDKTALVDDVLDAGARVLLVPRPRRFGKTLNLSMLRYFFERSPEDGGAIFADLAVARSERARPHFQRYPVIFISFKGIKDTTWGDCFAATAAQLARLYREHDYLLTEGDLSGRDAALFSAILDQRATELQCREALADLSRLLSEHHREQVVILVDEYDTPLHAAYTRGYFDEAITFFRGLLTGAFKDNPHLFKGVLTGILRVAKESIFSGLNNLGVYSILRSELSARFGFTEDEVARLAAALGQAAHLPGIRAWYNGYVFGGQVVYNPWSVLCFLDGAEKDFRPHWAATSSNDLIRDLLLAGGPPGFEQDLQALITGGTVEKGLDEDIALRDLDQRQGAIWSFLLFSGYLKLVAHRWEERRLTGVLAIPNQEVLSIYENVFLGWMERGLGSDHRVRALLSALLAGDAETFEEHLEELMISALSYHDVPHAADADRAPDLAGERAAERAPERVYQAFILGLLVNLGRDYEVRSNREAGLGRYDVMIRPRAPGRPGVVMELKALRTRRGETPEQALDAALAQIAERRYSAELREAGANPVHEIAAVFDGKRAWVRVRPAP